MFARRFCLINWKNTYTKNLLGQKYQTRQVHRLLAEPKMPEPKPWSMPKPWPMPKQMPNVEAFGLKYWCTRSPHLFRFSNQRCWEPSEIPQKQIIEIQNSIVQNPLELNMKIPPNSLNFNNKETPWNTIGLRIPGFSWALPFCKKESTMYSLYNLQPMVIFWSFIRMFPNIMVPQKWMVKFMEHPMNKWMICEVKTPYFWFNTFIKSRDKKSRPRENSSGWRRLNHPTHPWTSIQPLPPSGGGWKFGRVANVQGERSSSAQLEISIP